MTPDAYNAAPMKCAREETYERITAASRERLRRALQRLHDEVAASGLEESEIEQLIASEQR